MESARLVCLDCRSCDSKTGQLQEDMWGTIDLCSECLTQDASRTRDNKSHSPLHAMLEMKDCLPRTKDWAIQKTAIDIVKKLRKPSKFETDCLAFALISINLGHAEAAPEAHICTYCHEKLDTAYWCCLDCNSMSLHSEC
jgi:hypothetical protein